MGDVDSNGLDWQLLESLYEVASELAEPERATFVETACAGDDRLRRELQALLSLSPPAGRFFSRMGIAVRAAVPDADPASTDPLIGATIGHYRIEQRLGAGGMGIVYRAYDVRLQRVVALKFLPPHVSTEDTANRRFFIEARAAAALDHPNICTIFEVGEMAEPGPFIAMAYYAGETLERTLQRGRLEIPLAVDCALQIARGLAAAHQRGIVHRDIKPGNVMITADGVVKILDFGLARPPDAARTRSEGIFGTVAYMAPERAFGHAADHRTDLWSLGVTFYEMVTGQRPFRRNSEAAVLYAIAHEEPLSPDALRPDLPTPVVQIIQKLLQKDPANRYPDAGMVIADLEAVDTSSWVPAAGPVSVVSSGGGVNRPAGRELPRAADRRSAPRLLTRRRIQVIGAGLGTLIAAALIGFAIRARSGPASTGTGSDVPNVAVLYFQDNTDSDGPSGWLANALTSSLIGALVNVQGISPLSMNAVRPYRDSPRPAPAIAADLGAEWLIDGFIDRIGGRVVATVELIEGATGRRLADREVPRPVGEERALIEEVVRVAIEMLRERLGSEMRLGRWQAGTTDSVAFRLLHIAIGEVEEADRLAASANPQSGWARLRRADSTLARSAEADRDWPEPLIERAWVANKAARMAFGIAGQRDSVEAAFERGIEYASAALRRRMDVPRALEVLGVLRYTSWLLVPPPDTLAAQRLLSEAERDLRDALEANPDLARALNALSAIEYAQGRFDEALITTERAYRADRFLAPEEVLARLFSITFETAADAAAADWCAEYGNRFPESWFIAHCRLMLMAWSPASVANPDSAWRWVEQAASDAPEVSRASVRAELEILAAGVLARAGQGDSAQRVLDRVRAASSQAPLAADDNSRISRLQQEAGVRVLLRQSETALQLLAEYLTHRPESRNSLARSRRFRSLATDPRLGGPVGIP